jgi:hypothetical protein
LGEVLDEIGYELDACHDQVRLLQVWREEAINLGDVWCIRVRSCELRDVILRLVLGQHRLVAAKFNEDVAEAYVATIVIPLVKLTFVFSTGEIDVGLWFRGYSERHLSTYGDEG